MKKMFALVLSALLLVTAFAGCSGSSQKNGELVLFTWEGMFPQEVLDGFTEETGIEVTYSNFDYDETMLFGDDASVLHRVFEGERCNCLPDTLYHYRTRSGQITDTVTFPPRKLDDLRMYWDWLQYFATRPGREEYVRWATARYWRLFYQFWCQAGAAGNQAALKKDFMAHKKHLDAVLPDLVRSPLLPAGEKLRAVLFCISPTALYRTATAWGGLTAKLRKGN